MSVPREIPGSVIAEVAAVLSDYRTHGEINQLLMSAGAPGDPPPGNKLEKVRTWLRTVNAAEGNPFQVLGRVLEGLIDPGPPRTYGDALQEEFPGRCDRIHRALSRHGLSYRPEGIIFGGALSAPTQSLDKLIRERNLPQIQREFDRALANVETDPPAAVTAACSILESTFKIIIADEGLSLPSDQSIQPLWKVVQGHLALDPGKTADPNFRQALSGLTSIVQGVGGFRTHRGTAHGQGPGGPAVEARHARLAVHAAHTVTTFVLESWK